MSKTQKNQNQNWKKNVGEEWKYMNKKKWNEKSSLYKLPGIMYINAIFKWHKNQNFNMKKKIFENLEKIKLRTKKTLWLNENEM